MHAECLQRHCPDEREEEKGPPARQLTGTPRRRGSERYSGLPQRSGRDPQTEVAGLRDGARRRAGNRTGEGGFVAEMPSYGFNLPNGKAPRMPRCWAGLGGACKQVRPALRAGAPCRLPFPPGGHWTLQTRPGGQGGADRTADLPAPWRGEGDMGSALHSGQPTDQSVGSGQLTGTPYGAGMSALE